MEANQINSPAENSGIPQGIPTGVFVANNQSSPQAAAVQSAPVAPVAPVSEGPLDRILKGIARFFARVMGQADPITGAPNAASQALQKSQNIVGKIRSTANQAVSKVTDVTGQVVAKATDVASQAVSKATDVTGQVVAKATSVANQATQKVQQVVAPASSAPQATETVAPAAQPTPPSAS
ncbi:MAG: hypothetical protein NTY80_03900 [candidate division SR1 bacterium]|nr:hypothetical protein [candidate division SR1 bacterium]